MNEGNEGKCVAIFNVKFRVCKIFVAGNALSRYSSSLLYSFLCVKRVLYAYLDGDEHISSKK